MRNFEIKNETKSKLPDLPFVSMKDKILGKKYELSIAFISEKKSQELNKLHRGKDYVANILSFPLSEKSGEIVMNLNKAKKEASDFDMTYPKFVTFLFIHGLLHLKGWQHSSKMEEEEQRYLKYFS